MQSKIFQLGLLLFFPGCNNTSVSREHEVPTVNPEAENPYRSIGSIPTPPGFSRNEAGKNSFADWLRKIELKKDKTVYLFNGSPKYNQQAQFAVLDIPVGYRDLQQCADAVMRLRAQYLFDQKRFEEIQFKDNNGKTYAFKQPYSRNNLDDYLQTIFAMCGSASLSKQLKKVKDFKDIKPGDVLIRGGFPGHAVIVMDVADGTGAEKVYLLAQSYMPAQDIHVLLNPSVKTSSAWYSVTDIPTTIQTPEYNFHSTELKSW